MSGPLVYYVSENVGPQGHAPIVKQSIDVREFIVDFSQWLNTGEVLAQIWGFAALFSPTALFPSWQTDFPYSQPVPTPPAVDTNPLVLFGANILSTTQAEILLVNGTPGATYFFSFLVTAAPSQRMKEIDVLVSINLAVNPAMISSITLPALSVTVVGATAALAAGVSGSVNVSNTSGAPITITLPPTPVMDQTIIAKDVLGNAQTYTITWQGAAGATIDGAASFDFIVNGAAAIFKWTGLQWSVL